MQGQLPAEEDGFVQKEKGEFAGQEKKGGKGENHRKERQVVGKSAGIVSAETQNPACFKEGKKLFARLKKKGSRTGKRKKKGTGRGNSLRRSMEKRTVEGNPLGSCSGNSIGS